MKNKFLTNALYVAGKAVYQNLKLYRFDFFRKLARRLVEHMLTEEYKLCLTLKYFMSGKMEADATPWVPLDNVTVTAGSRLFIKGNKAFLPGLQNKNLWKALKVFKLQEEAQMKFKIKYLSKSVFLGPMTGRQIVEEKCFSALSPFSTSWVHWLFEIMPQLIELRQRPDSKKIKILVENDAPAQIYETITTFFPEENIIKIAFGERVMCRHLLVDTNENRGWSILWGRNVNNKLIETYQHDFDAMMMIRKMVYEQFSITDAPPLENVFIRRKARFRFIHNEQELAEILLAKQFKVIEPSAMSFREQVESFSNTNIIVAQAGASLANIIFMKPGSTVICMAADSSFLNYDYFLSIARTLNISFHYVLGKVDDEQKYSHKLHLSIYHPLNASFTIYKSNLENVLADKI